MRCLICNSNFDVEVLKLHYQQNHLVDKNNYIFKELYYQTMLLKDAMSSKCSLKTAGRKKNSFLFHRNQQTGGATNRGPVNILRRDPITYFNINFS